MGLSGVGGILILLIWFLVPFITPFILVVAGYYAYFRDGKILKVVLKLIAACIGYLVATAAAVPMYDNLVFAGNGINWIIFSSITLLYAGICYLLVCLVIGGLIKPWKLFVGLSNKHISIFESKER